MNLAQRLKKWNGGVQRGAASNFARKMRVGPSAVTMWLKGTRPGEELLGRIARELGIAPAEAEAMFPAKQVDLARRLEELEARLSRLERAYVRGEKLIDGPDETHDVVRPPRKSGGVHG